MRILVGLLMAAALCGCETAQVQPWEMGMLARDEMQWGTDVMEARMRDQVHASKEAASGGTGAAGGGCGCN